MIDLLKKQEATVQHHKSVLDDIKSQLHTQLQSSDTLIKFGQTSVAALMEVKESVANVARNVVRLQFHASDAMFFQSPTPLAACLSISKML